MRLAQVGGAVTLSELLRACEAQVEVRPREQTATLRAVATQLHWFAGVQIRNVATLAGNACTASPISDLNPLWVAAGATFRVASAGGARDIAASDFFVGYRCLRGLRVGSEGWVEGWGAIQGIQGGVKGRRLWCRVGWL